MLVETNKKLNRLIWTQLIMVDEIILPGYHFSTITLRIKEMEDIADYLHKIVKNMVEVEIEYWKFD